jgi:hypothetical protein
MGGDQAVVSGQSAQASSAAATERVIQIDIGCMPAAGPAAAPVLFMNDDVAFLVFNATRTSGGWRGRSDGTERAVVEIKRCQTTRFGYPSDAALAGHPLFEKGLGSFGVFEVLESAWVAQLAAQHAAARPAEPALPPQRHFVFTFHDSTLECVADDLVVVLTRDPLDEVIAGILPLMRQS